MTYKHYYSTTRLIEAETVVTVYVYQEGTIAQLHITPKKDEAWYEIPSLNLTSEKLTFMEALTQCQDLIRPLLQAN